MTHHVKSGVWMVLVPGVVAYLRYKGDPDRIVPVHPGLV